MKNLVIVESPAKAKTIEKFLGPDFTVLSSYGHIRDLKNKDFSIDVEGDFSPVYVIPDDKKSLVAKLKAAAAQADVVWLASDEDREGEAIAWHLAEVLGLKPENTRRIVFHEITKPAILNAIANPRSIDIDRVNAQQARRVLDRIVGFELSPVLWRKIKPALSAGRVQSVAVRLICEREMEVEAFSPESFFRINAIFLTPETLTPVKAECPRRMPDEKEALEMLERCRNARFEVSDIQVKPMKRSPQPPFTTSTLQQEASKRLGFSVNQTMMVAQKLYEDGRITYMRTDSTNLSDLAINDIAREIKEMYGPDWNKTRKYHTHSKGAQEAHEAIRPTYVSNRTIPGSEAEKKLYNLIWQRAVASQMADALLEKTNVTISSPDSPDKFHTEGEVVKFPGFLSVYGIGEDADDPSILTPDRRDQNILPPLSQGMPLSTEKITATQRFTQAPPRYTEATLVKKMEDLGIGRPSTYAPTIHTIQAREYVKRGDMEGTPRNYEVITLTDGKLERQTLTENTGSQKGKLVPTDIGRVVNDFLTEAFPDILDYNFTAKVEEKFDEIAEGKLGWKNEIADFYGDFHPGIETINTNRSEHKIGERVLGTDPRSGRQVSVKIGRFGPVVQIGEASDEEKPLFASLPASLSLYTLTLDQALKLFELPRTLGELDGLPVTAAAGRFGPYVKHGSLYVSIPKGQTPQAITFEEAEALIRAKQEAEANKLIKEFEEMPGLQILNGRYGPYMAYKPEGAKKAVNYRLSKDLTPADITLEQAKEIMAKQDAAPKKPRRKTASK
ncbi:MAG: type I DNA topoisomerase [Bacteroidales bacterium]|nr:type I DNA topoisomerase [Bacteroidales bacterium]